MGNTVAMGRKLGPVVRLLDRGYITSSVGVSRA